MGTIADRVDALTVDAASPDGNIAAHIRSRADIIEVTFRPGAYRRYREPALADQLAGLASLLLVRYRRYEQEIVETVLADPLTDDSGEENSERRRYLDAVKRVVATGADDRERIRLTSRCLVSWEVQLSAEALAELSEEQFVAALVTAVRRLLDHYRTEVFKLQDEIYDLGYPDTLRRAIGLQPRGAARSHR
jgi:hypothetical protein